MRINKSTCLDLTRRHAGCSRFLVRAPGGPPNNRPPLPDPVSGVDF